MNRTVHEISIYTFKFVLGTPLKVYVVEPSENETEIVGLMEGFVVSSLPPESFYVRKAVIGRPTWYVESILVIVDRPGKTAPFKTSTVKGPDSCSRPVPVKNEGWNPFTMIENLRPVPNRGRNHCEDIPPINLINTRNIWCSLKFDHDCWCA